MASKDWHTEDIKAAIRKTGVTLSELAKQHGRARTSMSMVLREPWPAIERIIADRLNTEPQTIWPSRYDELGRPLPASSKNDNSGRQARRHRQIHAS